MEFTGTVYYKDSVEVDVSNDIYISPAGDYYRVSIPIETENFNRIAVNVNMIENFEINSDHEYSIKFEWKPNVSLSMTCSVQLVYFDNAGNELKVQEIAQSSTVSTFNTIDVDFKPDVSDISGGYNCKLRLAFLQSGWNGTTTTQSVFISKEIELIDKDDDTGWFQKILNKINDVWESIKSLPDKIGAFINSLGDRIDNAFQVVGDGIVNGIREALQWAFVPSEEYLDGFADSWQSWFESHFGVFSQVTNFLVDMIGEFEDLFTGNYSFIFPEVSVPIMDKNIVLIEKQTVDIAQWLEEGSFGARLYEIYTTCVWAIIIYCVMKYALVVQDIIFAGNRMVLNET